MKTLLMYFSGMQSWGCKSSTFSFRDTATEPTKSGTIGVISCAEGRPRNDEERPASLPPLAVVAALPLAVRIDSAGKIMQDYHVTKDVLMTSRKDKNTVLGNRCYLMDAAFLVGIEGPDDIIVPMSQALDNPVWPIYLGRKSCPPAEPVNRGLRNVPLIEALLQEPFIWRGYDEKPIEMSVKFVVECKDGALRMDVPVSYQVFTSRRVKTIFLPVKNIQEKPNVSF